MFILGIIASTVQSIGGFLGNLLHTLDDPNDTGTPAGDRFGDGVDITESYAIVGAKNEDNVTSGSGTAYIFDTSDGALLHTLDNPGAAGNTSDLFGESVGITESYAIVGADNEDDVADNSGTAYIFDTSDGALLHILDNPNDTGTAQNDHFGEAVAISESYAIVGAPDEDNVTSNSGTAYIFDTSDGSLLHTLDNPGASGNVNDRFGNSVGITESYAIVGSMREDDGGADAGTAYIFDTSDGSLLYTLDNPNDTGTPAGDNFGRAVAITESYAIVSADQEDNVTTGSGTAYIFDTSDGSLLHTLDNPGASGNTFDGFGRDVDITESRSIVGAWAEDNVTTGSGTAYIFDNSDGALLHTLDNPGASGNINDNFGFKVGITESYAIVGSPNEDDVAAGSGTSYIYD